MTVRCESLFTASPLYVLLSRCTFRRNGTSHGGLRTPTCTPSPPAEAASKKKAFKVVAMTSCCSHETITSNSGCFISSVHSHLCSRTYGRCLIEFMEVVPFDLIFLVGGGDSSTV